MRFEIPEGVLPGLTVPFDEKLRTQLNDLSTAQLQNKLQLLDNEKWQSLNNSDKQNPRRLVRHIELIMMKPYDNKFQISNFKFQKFNTLKIGLTAPKEILDEKVDARVLSRIKQGMTEEVQDLYKKGLSLERMRKLGLEYGVLADFLDGKIKNKEELIRILQTKIRQYMRRQLTWFKKEPEVNWFDIESKNYLALIEKSVRKWYDNPVNET